MARIFSTYPLPGESFKTLAESHSLTVYTGPHPIPRKELLDGVRDAEVLICLLTEKIDKELFDSAPKLKIVANYAVGYDNIDVSWATVYDVAVINTPDVLTDASADHTIALMLAVARRITEGEALIRSGQWKGWAPDLLLGTEVSGKVLGIIGMGRIGRAVARRARAFGMEILYNNKSPLPPSIEREFGAKLVSLSELLSNSDFISLHCPLTPETKHLLNKKTFQFVKRGAILINTARGPVIDENALVEALEDGILSGAGLDVFENEPDIHPELLKLPQVVLTPHLGSGTKESRSKMTETLIQGIEMLLREEKPHNIVNPEVLPKIRLPETDES